MTSPRTTPLISTTEATSAALWTSTGMATTGPLLATSEEETSPTLECRANSAAERVRQRKAVRISPEYHSTAGLAG